ncbi:MAG: NUDIX domain-containing protein [Lachnospiraceae bacterium]|nr:NUDIX domain-containing protein [Lachnospiraceae bacterium]
MRRLFTLDLHDYDETWPHDLRPTVRGIIEKDGKIALVHKKEFDYYAFPGGGIDAGETYEEALIREVREETGLIVIPESITEYGGALRLNKSTRFQGKVFEQENFNYKCQVLDEVSEQNLDAEEAEEGFELSFVTPEEARRKNRYDDHGPENGGIWLERENILIEMQMFEKKLAKEPLDIKDGIYYFAAHDHGDFFDEEDVAEWDNGRLENNWKKRNLLENPTTKKMIETIVANGKEVIDLACGPGMGLIPSVKQLDAAFHCTATDANAMVLEHWKKYLDWNFFTHGVGFAQFSVLDMPFKDNSVPSFSSYIGLSSTRNGEAGYDVAIKEVYRCLMPGGYLYAIESEWMDVPAILQVFEKMGQEPWTCFTKKQMSWHDRFLTAGFEIVSEELVEHHYFTEEDNDLGEASVRFGIPVGTKETAFVLRKK